MYVHRRRPPPAHSPERDSAVVAQTSSCQSSSPPVVARAAVGASIDGVSHDLGGRPRVCTKRLRYGADTTRKFPPDIWSAWRWSMCGNPPCNRCSITKPLQLQYGLVHRAVALGWSEKRVVVIDDDLGQSGTSVEGRQGFQRLVAEVGWIMLAWCWASTCRAWPAPPRTGTNSWRSVPCLARCWPTSTASMIQAIIMIAYC